MISEMSELDNSLGLTTETIMQLPPRLRMRALNFLVRWRRYDDALPLARQLAETQADGLLYRSQLAKILAALGRHDEAASIIEDHQYQHPQKPNTLAAMGDLEMARGNLPGALKHYLEMLKVNPESPKAWRRLAGLYIAAGQVDKAHIYCRKVIEYYENKHAEGDDWGPHPDVLRVLARIHKAKGDETLSVEIETQLSERERKEEENLRDAIAAPPPPAKPAKQPARRPSDVAPTAPEPEPEPERIIPPVPPLLPDAKECLVEVFGHPEFRRGQEEVISRALAGQNVIVTMPTGAGKSLCYQLPAALGRRVVVISPLIALMKDQVDGLPKALAKVATVINSTLDSDELERRQNAIAAGKFNLIYAAPERLRQMPFLHALKKAGVDLFVVDEVHCVSIWGHDFRPDYLFITLALEKLGNPPFCGMTATAGPEMRKEIESQLKRELVPVSVGTYRPNLLLEVRQASKNLEKLRALSRICQSETGSGIIYANSRKKTEEISSFLRTMGIDAGHYHAGLPPDERAATQEAFMSGKCRVMAATIAFGMGVDKRDVRFVAHFSLPKSLENYYQEAGRAGRDGKNSRCILFYAPGDKAQLTIWSAAEEMTMDDLKAVYESIKKSVPNGSGPVHDDDVQRDTTLDETGVRVAISMLERVGLVKRGMDVPMSATVTVRSTVADDEFTGFVEASRLRRGQAIALEFTELCNRSGIALSELEPKLLDWRDNGWLQYRSSGRAMYIELPRQATSARATLQQMIDRHKARAKEKVRRLANYAKSERCRHDHIARHFGESPIEGCRSCDNCVKGSLPATMTPDHTLILSGMLTLPTRLNKSGLVKALVKSPRCPIQKHEWEPLGAFSGRTQDQVAKLIDDLVDWGYLEKDGTPIRPLLTLTPAGRKLAVKEDGTADA